jgi:hypothetical protein
MTDTLPPLIKPNNSGKNSPIKLLSPTTTSPIKSGARRRSEKRLSNANVIIDLRKSFSEKSDRRKSISLGSTADISNLFPPKNIPPACLDDILKKIDKDGYKIINKNQLQSKLMTGLFIEGCDCEEIAAGILEISDTSISSKLDARHVFEQPSPKRNNGLGTEATREMGIHDYNFLSRNSINNYIKQSNYKMINNNQYSSVSMDGEELKKHAAYISVSGKNMLFKKYKDMNNQRLVFSGSEASILSNNKFPNPSEHKTLIFILIIYKFLLN